MTDSGWIDEVRERIHIALSEFSAMRAVAHDLDLGEIETLELLAPYSRMLDSLYAEDFPLARLLDESDLVIGADGPALQHDNLPINIVIGLLDRTRTRVIDVAKAIANITGKVPADVQPGLYGFVPGSVYLGFSAPEPPPEDMFQDASPYYAAVQRALRSIGTVSHLVASGASDDELEDAVEDPSERDATITAVRDLAPSRQSHIAHVTISGRATTDDPERGAAVLDPDDRARLRSTLSTPGRTAVESVLIGTIREMDLDKKRFYLRQIDGLDAGLSVRGIFTRAELRAPRALLGQRVRVDGKIESDPDGRPRLVFVQGVQVLGDDATQEPL